MPRAARLVAVLAVVGGICASAPGAAGANGGTLKLRAGKDINAVTFASIPAASNVATEPAERAPTQVAAPAAKPSATKSQAAPAAKLQPDTKSGKGATHIGGTHRAAHSKKAAAEQGKKGHGKPPKPRVEKPRVTKPSTSPGAPNPDTRGNSLPSRVTPVATQPGATQPSAAVQLGAGNGARGATTSGHAPAETTPSDANGGGSGSSAQSGGNGTTTIRPRQGNVPSPTYSTLPLGADRQPHAGAPLLLLFVLAFFGIAMTGMVFGAGYRGRRRAG